MADAALTRRSLARGAAWSVPVIAVAAAVPAFAASPCVTTFSYMLDWGNNAKTTYVAPIGTGATKVGTASALAPTGSAAAPVGVTFTSTYVTNNSTDRRASDNLTVPSTTNIGGLGANVQGLLVAHASTSSSRDGFRQQVVIHFDRSVSDLTFVITDVDSRDGGWYDQIELTGTRTGTYNTRTLTGSGTTADPWRNSSNNNSIGNTSSDGNVAIAYSTPVTDITLTFWSSENGSNQLIRLTDFAFTAAGC